MYFCLATLAKTAKKYAVNPSISDVAFLNALLEPYVIAGNVRARGGADFRLDKHRTSKILNCEADVPTALRKVELQHGLERRVAAECGMLFDETINPELTESLENDIFTLLDASDEKQACLKRRLAEKAGSENDFMACALVGVMAFSNKMTAETVMWRSGTGSLCWCVGDLFRFGFGNRKRAKNLVVVPVDCKFNTHVTRTYEGSGIKGVSEHTVHGQWLTRMAQSGVPEGEIARRIDCALADSHPGTDRNRTELPIGTVVAIETANAAYLLLAVSVFDEKGNAKSTRANIADAIDALLRYYDENGQGANMYVPLIGSGLSRSGLQTSESFDLISQIVTEGSAFVGGKVTLVVQHEAAIEIGLIR